MPLPAAYADPGQGEALGVDEVAVQGEEPVQGEEAVEGLGAEAESGSDVEVRESTGAVLEAPQLRPDATVRANLVLLVKFKGDTEGDPGTTGADAGFNGGYSWDGLSTRWEYLQQRINSTTKSEHQEPPFRFSIRTFSNGAFDVESYFPQTNEPDKTVNYISLDHEASYYVDRDDAMITEALRKFNEAYPGYDAASLDTDGDGFVDNLLLIPAVETSGTFTSHKSISDMKPAIGSGSGKQISVYNIIEACTESYGLVSDTFKSGTAVHEYLHTLDARDYYRSSDVQGADIPVGIWDVMAVSVRYSWPLALTRRTGGWCDIPEKPAEGTYELCAPGDEGSLGSGAGKKNQAIIVKTPSTSSEYFVIEYRQKSNVSFGLDSKINGSGVIVYRVNEKYAEIGNMAGGDYVYVFREGETGMTNGRANGAGDIMNAQVSTAAYASGNRTSIGTTDLSKGLADGAICYSDGQNSGLVVKPVEQADGSITVEVSHADWAADGAWRDVADASGATASFGTVHLPAVATATDGANVYALAEDRQASRSQVWKYDTAASSWSRCGADIVGLGSVSLAWFDGSLYAAGAAKQTKTVQVKRFDGTSWADVANTPATSSAASYPAMAVSGGRLHVLADSGGEHTKAYRLEGASLVQQGGEVPVGSASNSVAFDLGGSLAVAAGSIGSEPWRTYVYRLVDGSWTKDTELGTSAASALSVAASKSATYVYAHQSSGDGGQAYLATLSADGSGSVVQELSSEATRAASLSGCIAVDDGHIYLVGANGSGAVSASAAPLDDPSLMTPLGSQVYRSGFGVSSVVVGGNVYCAVADDDASAVAVRVHDALPGTGIPDPGPSPDPDPDPTPDPGPGPNPNPNPDPTPDPDPGPNPDNPGGGTPVQKTESELSGSTRIGTALAIARATHSGENPKGVIVARSDNFPDALAASTLAGAKGYPILLNPTDWLDSEVRGYLSGLRGSLKEVILIGDTNALSKKGVEEQIKKALPSASVKRIGGADRIETAKLIRSEAKRAGAAGKTVVLARSDNFPDALSISPYCAATGALLYLVNPGSSLDAGTLRELTGYDQVLIVGDSNAVSSRVDAALKAKSVNVRRLAGGIGNAYGISRYGTSAAIADWMVKESGAGFDYGGIVFATGKNFPDALAGGPLCGKLRHPIVLVDAGAYSAVSTLTSGETPSELYWLGSPYALSSDLRNKIKAALGY